MSDPRFQDPLYSAGFVDGATDERERIIKLLEAEMACPDDCDHYECGVGWLVVLKTAIKGEQK